MKSRIYLFLLFWCEISLQFKFIAILFKRQQFLFFFLDLSFRYMEFSHFLAIQEDLSIRCFDKLLINKLEFYVRIMQDRFGWLCVCIWRGVWVIVCVVKRTFKAEANNLNRQTIEHLHYCIRLCFLLCLI